MTKQPTPITAKHIEIWGILGMRVLRYEPNVEAWQIHNHIRLRWCTCRPASPRWRPNPEIAWHHDWYPRNLFWDIRKTTRLECILLRRFAIIKFWASNSNLCDFAVTNHCYSKISLKWLMALCLQLFFHCGAILTNTSYTRYVHVPAVSPNSTGDSWDEVKNLIVSYTYQPPIRFWSWELMSLHFAIFK